MTQVVITGHTSFCKGTHSTIASTSMLVPTIGLAYSVKAHGILRDLIRSRSVVYDVPGLQVGELVGRADDLLENRDAIVQELEHNVQAMKERALVTPRLCAQLLATSGKQAKQRGSLAP